MFIHNSHYIFSLLYLLTKLCFRVKYTYQYILQENSMNTFITFENRICLVTGAGSENGIGFSTARILG